MVSLKESGWVEFDIKNAVRAWLNERKPNYGLVIEVENENQDPLDPRNYFRSAPCFKSSSSSGLCSIHSLVAIIYMCIIYKYPYM